jgi:hypothetical protein
MCSDKALASTYSIGWQQQGAIDAVAETALQSQLFK